MNNKNGAKKRVLKILEEIGPLSAIEIAEHAGWSTSYARAAVSYCRSLEPRILYVKTYLRSEEFGRYYPRAVYALGDHKDAIKPPPLSQSECNLRHRLKKGNKGQVNSVWVLGVPVDKRRLTSRKRPDVAKKLRNGIGSGLEDAEAR